MRIQVLNLPPVSLGDATEQRFAVIFDEVPLDALTEDDGSIAALERFGREVGAASVLSFNGKIEVP